MTSIQETVSSALVKRDRAGRTRYTKSYKTEVATYSLDRDSQKIGVEEGLTSVRRIARGDYGLGSPTARRPYPIKGRAWIDSAAAAALEALEGAVESQKVPFNQNA